MDKNKGLRNIKPGVLSLEPYLAPKIACRIKLNQNESPFELPGEMKKKLADRLARLEWRRYPDPNYSELKDRLREHAGVENAGILVGPGSNSFILTVLLTTVSPGTPVIVPRPSFPLYEKVAQLLDGRVIPVPLAPDLKYDVDRFIEACRGLERGVVIICNPNNPTGSTLNSDDTRRLLESTSCLVFIDEAYQEFAGENCGPLLGEFDNLVIIMTFSKVFGLAGLRIGYLMGRPEITGEIAKGQMPYSLNTLCQEIALFLLDHPEQIEERVEHVQRERERLYRLLAGLPGIRPYPSGANFLLFDTGRDAGAVMRGLAERGILVRDVSGYPFLERHLRVTIGQTEENDSFIEALEQTITETG